MSLTSYRAAPPRADCDFCVTGAMIQRLRICFALLDDIEREKGLVLIRSGGDLLSHVLRRSTISATALNGRVRNGSGCFARAIATRPNKNQFFQVEYD
jgi:hypothetical protein